MKIVAIPVSLNHLTFPVKYMSKQL